MLPDQTYVLCDFETTGVDPDTDRPIEVGLLFCDRKMRVIHAYESLIGYAIDGLDAVSWDALRIHKITPPMLKDARTPAQAAKDIHDICSQIRGRKVLLSDNAQFEHRFMLKLLADDPRPWPFHYCTWDSSLLLEATGVGDPTGVPHRAMGDVGLLPAAIVDALKRIQS